MEYWPDETRLMAKILWEVEIAVLHCSASCAKSTTGFSYSMLNFMIPKLT